MNKILIILLIAISFSCNAQIEKDVHAYSDTIVNELKDSIDYLNNVIAHKNQLLSELENENILKEITAQTDTVNIVIDNKFESYGILVGMKNEKLRIEIIITERDLNRVIFEGDSTGYKTTYCDSLYVPITTTFYE